MGDASEGEVNLIQKAASGDMDSFAVLYMRHLDSIYRYLYFRVGDEQEAQDLAEQVFLQAWEALPGYRERGSRMIHWLYRIAHNLVVDFQRKGKFVVSDALDEEAGWQGQPPSSLEQVIKEEEAAELSAAIRTLPEIYQQVIILRFVEGLKHAEIARIVEKSEIACRVIQYQALAALNRILSTTIESDP
jgi:RNA polymerase sigma-70 factor (ECF subfamily)